jgi:hypothetical protein
MPKFKKIDPDERRSKGFQKFRQLHEKQYDVKNYVKLFLQKQNMFESDIIMKNIDVFEPSINRSVDDSSRNKKLLITPTRDETPRNIHIIQKARLQQTKRDKVYKRCQELTKSFLYDTARKGAKNNLQSNPKSFMFSK